MCRPARSFGRLLSYGGETSGLCGGEIVDTNAPAAAFAGRSVALIGCPVYRSFDQNGSHLGIPASYTVGAILLVKLFNIPGFFEGTGSYAMVIKVTVSGTELKYGGGGQVNCADGSFIAYGNRKI